MSRSRPTGSRTGQGAAELRRLVLVTVLLGAVVSCSVAWSFRGRVEGPALLHLPLGTVTLIALALTALAERLSVTLRHDDEEEALTFYEAAVVADLLVLPPGLALLAALGGLAVACLLKRRGWLKSAFNLGAHATGTALLVGTVALVAVPGAGIDTKTVLAVVAGTLGFAAVNLVLLAAVLQASIGADLRTTLREGWRLSAIMAIGTCGIGAVAVALLKVTPALVPFTLMPAGALAYAFRAAAQEALERERSTKLLALSQVLAGRLVAEDLLGGFLGLLREAFRVDTARVILEGDELRGGTVVLADAEGVRLGELSAVDAALLARTSETAELLDDGLPDGWGRIMLAPLDADSSRLGVLALVCPPGKPVLVARDLAVLTPLVSALGVALRGAEHLAQLTEGTDKLQTVVQHSSDGILVLDADRRVQVWNPALVSLTGVGGELALGRTLGDLVQAWDEHGAVVDPCEAGWALLRPDTPRCSIELQLVRSDGDQRWVRMSHAAVFEADAIVQDVVLVYDVTRERQVERMKADFIATVSHELRTPVTPIKGYIDLLRRRGEEFSPEKRKEFLDTVADRVSHLQRLVEDLLLASQVASPASAVRKSHGDLVLLARRAVDDFGGSAERLHVELPDEPAPIACDPTRVVQVIGNLVSNALKYSPDDAPVHVLLTIDASGDPTHPHGTATVEVSDEGQGIPADQLERVFEKFHRVGDPLTMTTSGTGLGLYIARQLTEAMAGRISVTSVLGTGSIFRFTMPITPLPASGPDGEAGGADGISGRSGEQHTDFGPFAGPGGAMPRPRRRPHRPAAVETPTAAAVVAAD